MDMVIQILPVIGMCLALGAVAGFLAGLIGVGGGIVLVPGLFYILSLTQDQLGFDPAHIMHICVGTSLAVIVPTGFSSALAHNKRGAVDLNYVRQIGIGILIGVLIATYIVKELEGQTLKMIFAGALPVFAVLMIIGRRNFISKKPAQPSRGKNASAGVVIGLVSSLIGIGGATLSVPYMSMNGVAMHRAVGTASALGLVISIPAAIGFMIIGWGLEGLPALSLGYVHVLAWLSIIPASVMIAPLGARVSHKIAVKPLRIGFAIFMMIVALNMWRDILTG